MGNCSHNNTVDEIRIQGTQSILYAVLSVYCIVYNALYTIHYTVYYSVYDNMMYEFT